MNKQEALFLYGTNANEIVRLLADTYISLFESGCVTEILEDNEDLFGRACKIGPIPTFIFTTHLIALMADEGLSSLAELRTRMDLAAKELIDTISKQVARMIIEEGINE